MKLLTLLCSLLFIGQIQATEEILHSKVKEMILLSESIPSPIKNDVAKTWETLVQESVIERSGTDQEIRPLFVALQGVVEQVLSDELQKEIHSLKAIIHTPMPATPLCMEGNISPELVAPSIESDPNRLFTVKARATILRDFLFKGADLYVVYPKQGLFQRTEEQRAIYKKALSTFSTHLFDAPLDCDTIPSELIGATYVFKNALGKTYVFAIQMTQAKDPQEMGHFGLWFGPLEQTAIQKRIHTVSQYLEQNGSTLLKMDPVMDMQTLLREAVDNNEAMGAAIGLIDQGKIQFFSYGKMSAEGNEPISENTLFEIGSISKVFTTLALMDMVHQGEVQLDDPIELYLPDVTVPAKEGQKITLRHLALHNSGLPRLPNNLTIKNPANPYADYSEEQLYEFLNHYSLPRAPGEQFEYSNVGMGLLGHILSLKSGISYESLISDRILKKLHMEQTSLTLTPDMQRQFATGHHMGQCVDHWDFLPCLAGCGGIRSNVKDMTQFLAANLGLINSPITDLLRQCHEKQLTVTPKLHFGLGWGITVPGEMELIGHDGGTGGFLSFFGFNPKTQRGIVILTNSTEDWANDFGTSWLDPTVKKPLIDHALAKNPEYLNRFVGSYQMTTTDQSLEIAVWGKRLICAVGEDGAVLYPEQLGVFGMKGFLNGKMHFIFDETGSISHVEGRLDDGSVLWEAIPKKS